MSDRVMLGLDESHGFRSLTLETESPDELLPGHLPDGLWEEFEAVWAMMNPYHTGYRFEELP